MVNEQFVQVHGSEEFAILITVNSDRNHVWSAKDREEADRYVDFWAKRAEKVSVMTMKDYLDENRLS